MPELPDRDDIPSRAAAVLYGAASRGHAAFWNSGFRRPWQAPVPVISIGNLAVGGTGKTPAVIHLAGELRRLGWHPAILTRGHGRRGSVRVVLAPGEATPGPDLAGDEPLEMFEALSDVPIVIAADRKGSALLAVAQFHADVLILDDGFQHRPLARDIDIVLVDAARPFGNGRLLPAGPLREPPSALRRADMIVLTRAEDAPDINSSRSLVQREGPEAWIGTARHRVIGLRPIGTPKAEGTPPRDSVLAVSGIARPETFLAGLRATGHEVGQHRDFPDHHRFDTADLALVLREADGAPIVTTAKDAVRWRDVPGFSGVNWWILVVRFEPEPGFAPEVVRRLEARGVGRPPG